MDFQIDTTIDAKGKKCPMPSSPGLPGHEDAAGGAGHARRGDRQGVEERHPLVGQDTGNELLEASTTDGVHRYVIRKL